MVNHAGYWCRLEVRSHIPLIYEVKIVLVIKQTHNQSSEDKDCGGHIMLFYTIPPILVYVSQNSKHKTTVETVTDQQQTSTNVLICSRYVTDENLPQYASHFAARLLLKDGAGPTGYGLSHSKTSTS